jgi:DnaJ-class molecular chaperone
VGDPLTFDHYAVLGVGPTVGLAEIRRAYRLMALRHHPDRAGPDATATFQRIAEAYRVLSDPSTRSRYDASLRAAAAPARNGPSDDLDELIVRLSGPLDALIARGAVRCHASGLIELLLTPAERRRGGTAAIALPMVLPCPTCGGVAVRNRLWCRRCEFEGVVIEEITLCVPIPPSVLDGATFRLTLDRFGTTPPLLIRVRC